MAQFRFSANTGYLWRELPFVERIRLAAKHGFDAVEFHDEAHDADLTEVEDVLAEHELPVLSMNVRMGKTFGNAADVSSASSAKQNIDLALGLVDRLNVRALHVLAGLADGTDAMESYIDNLGYALENTDRIILIEPVCYAAVPGYFLNSLEKAELVLREISHPRLKIMFDCFHIRHETDDLLGALQRNIDDIGHVQISSFPDRNEPVDGVIKYSELLQQFSRIGYSDYFGCEYNPENTVESGLGWRSAFCQNRD